MPNPPTRPRLRDRYARRQDELVRASARVFAERGYHATSIGDLAASLDLAAGGLYHYIGGKDDLLVRICDELLEPLLVSARLLAEEGREPADELRALVRLWVEHVVEHRDHLRVFEQVRHAVEGGDQWADVRRRRKDFEDLLDGVLGRALAATGVVVDRRVALGALLGMVNHTAQWFRPGGRLSPAEVADGYVDLVLGARS